MNSWMLPGAGVFAFLAAAILTWLLIPVLKRVKAGQNIREDGPSSHLSKAGTPSMGGVAMVAAVLLSAVLFGGMTKEMIPAIVGFVLFGLVGFMDDYLKIIRKQNLGLRAWQKFSMQFAIALGFSLWRINTVTDSGMVRIPFTDRTVDFGIWYLPFIVFTILAMVNAINLTDGLDGLASGVTAIVAVFFGGLAWQIGQTHPAVFFAGLTGACLGFLVFNRHPARIFMGDTGSLALGGAVSLAAITMGCELFLPVVGIIYVLEALSVVLQVGYFKFSGGKRLFRMAPLHHHFEQCGMKEKNVVIIFWLVTFAVSAVAMLIL